MFVGAQGLADHGKEKAKAESQGLADSTAAATELVKQIASANTAAADSKPELN